MPMACLVTDGSQGGDLRGEAVGVCGAVRGTFDYIRD